MSSAVPGFEWDDRQDQPDLVRDRALKKRLRRGAWWPLLRSLAHSCLASPKIGYRWLNPLRTQTTANLHAIVGVAIDPIKYPLEQQMDLLDELGTQHTQVRMFLNQPETFPAITDAVRRLHADGLQTHIVLCQDRAIVEQPTLWRERCQMAHALLPATSSIQLGTAINRLKWGVAHSGEYLQLIQHSHDCFPGRTVLGSSVIDFEPLATAATLFHRQHWHLDGVASLLYVDRRGPPEATQLGFFNTARKIQTIAAMMQASRAFGNRLWLTEVNWPLQGHEGYAPAGPDVCVSEEDAAQYLLRYIDIACRSRLVERVYVWQLLAEGYGLVDPRDTRRRPAFTALQKALQNSQQTAAHATPSTSTAKNTAIKTAESAS